MSRAILLTGRPGCGKTTLIRRVVANLSQPAGGFYTREIREAGVRKGFEIHTLDGQQAILAHVNIRGPHRIGKYGVDISALDRLGVAAIEQALSGHEIIVIDEIGSMELLSDRFRSAVLRAVQGDSAVLGTITKRPTPYTNQIRSMPGVTVIEVTPANRDALLAHILRMIPGNQDSAL